MWYKQLPDGMAMFVKVVPGAAQTKIMGVLGNRLKIRVAAQPEDGKANRELITFLADLLGIPTSAISITFGHTFPEKNLLIQGVDIDRLEQLPFVK